MGELMRAHDWERSPLGPPEGWPQSLRSIVGLILNSRYPMFLAWGPELTFLYNDGYAPIFGKKHPHMLGVPFQEAWSEIWQDIKPLIDSALAGTSTFNEDLHLVMERNGYPEDTWYSFSYSPVRDDSGEIAGMFCACMETTGQVLAKKREAEERARMLSMFDQAPGFMAILEGPEHRITYHNATYAQRMGGRVALGKTVAEAIPEAEAQGFIALFDKVFATGEPLRLEAARFEAKQPDGSYVEQFVDVAYQPVRDATGQVSGIFIEGYSVTDRVQARRQADARQAELEQVMTAAPAAIWIGRTAERGAIEANAMGRSILGLADDAPMAVEGPPGGQFSRGRFVHPSGRPYQPKEFPLARAISGEQIEGLEIEVAFEGAPSKFLLVNAQPFGDGGQSGAVAVGIDITERRRLEQELRDFNVDLAKRVEETVAERSILASVIDETKAFVQVAAPDFTYLAVNKASARRFERLFGFEPKPGDNFIEALAPWPEHQARARDLWSRAFAGEDFVDISEFNVGGVDRRTYESRFTPLRDPDGKIVAAYQFVTEITDRVRAEARLRTIFDTSFQFQGLVDIDGTLLESNRTSLEAIGCEAGDVIGMKVWDTPWFTGTPKMPDAVQLAVKNVLETKQSYTQETTLQLQGRPRSFNISIRPMLGDRGDVVGMITEATETTALRAAESALLHAQKLEGMGQLTGGVAHDFNNLLTPILGALDLLQRRGLGNELERSLIEGAMQSAERARTLVQRLLAFARRQPLRAVAVDIGKLIVGMADLVSRTTGPQVRVVTEVEPELPSAIADANQLELAVLNLAVNARDAMPGGGTLRILANQRHVETLDQAGVQAGRYVCLSVADDGDGMDEATCARAIEPFFSTKGIGQGTGLGLSMAHGLASQLGGALTIESHRGIGTNVCLWLPATERPVEIESDVSTAPTRGAQGLVLLVDDEPLVRASTAEMLVDVGFEVVQADSGEAAIEKIRAGLSPDILVTDHLMPGMEGTKLAHAAVALRPGLKVLVISGYAEREGIDSSLARLAKPFRSADLTNALAVLQGAEQN